METLPEPVAYFEKMPDEILLQIFSHMDFEDLLHTAFVCRRWFRLLKGTKSLWLSRVFTADGIKDVRSMLRIIPAMPRFSEVRIVWDYTHRMYVEWPVATIYLPKRQLPKEIPPQCAFSTERLLIGTNIVSKIDHCLKWVKTRSLKSIHVARDFNVLLGWVDLRSAQHLRPNKRKRPAGSAEALCPALETLNIQCRDLPHADMQRLCRLGPVRNLHIVAGGVVNLAVLNKCVSRLKRGVVVNFSNSSIFPLHL